MANQMVWSSTSPAMQPWHVVVEPIEVPNALKKLWQILWHEMPKYHHAGFGGFHAIMLAIAALLGHLTASLEG